MKSFLFMLAVVVPVAADAHLAGITSFSDEVIQVTENICDQVRRSGPRFTETGSAAEPGRLSSGSTD
jgi:hypothetical protein